LQYSNSNPLNCVPGCSHGGECINNNKCKCMNGWTGSFCEEKTKYQKNKWLPYVFYSLGLIEYIFIGTLVVLTIVFREMKEIKLGKPFFLISILIGLIFQISIIFLIFPKPNPALCTVKIWLKYMVI